jgi:hypothetical protein
VIAQGKIRDVGPASQIQIAAGAKRWISRIRPRPVYGGPSWVLVRNPTCQEVVGNLVQLHADGWIKAMRIQK